MMYRNIFLLVALAATPMHVLCNLERGPEVEKQLLETLHQAGLPDSLAQKIVHGQRLSRADKQVVEKAEHEKYIEMRRQGYDEVSDTANAAALRSYRLRFKKRRGRFWKKMVSLNSVLYPDVKAPNDFRPGDRLYVKTGTVNSKNNPLPYSFYDLPINCPKSSSSNNILDEVLGSNVDINLGSMLQGQRVDVAPFYIRALQNQPCSIVCSVDLTPADIEKAAGLVSQKYRTTLTLDDMPVMMRSKEFNYAATGYPIGFLAPTLGSGAHSLADKNVYLYNHFKFRVSYQIPDAEEEEDKKVRITGFDIHPVSFNHQAKAQKVGHEYAPQAGNQCQFQFLDNAPDSYQPLPVGSQNGTRIYLSYEVEFVKSATDWEDRWDVLLLRTPDDDAHYANMWLAAIVIATEILLIGSHVIKAIRKDVDSFTSGSTKAGETGWLAVHGDVFRPPQTSPLLLSVFVGTGAEIGASMLLTLLSAYFQWINPIRSGHLLSAILFFFCISGAVGGFVSVHYDKHISGCANWKHTVAMTAIALPGGVAILYLILNVGFRGKGASSAISFPAAAALLLLWCFLHVPMVCMGGYLASRAAPFNIPTKISQEATEIPSVPIHADIRLLRFIGGILPFALIVVELNHCMSAMWLQIIFYQTHFVLNSWIIVVVSCGLVSISVCYIQLRAEDYRWWWTSFWSCASAGMYMFLYCIWFLQSKLDMTSGFPTFVYLSYMGAMSLCFGLFCGSIGFLAAFSFCGKIYSEAFKED